MISIVASVTFGQDSVSVLVQVKGHGTRDFFVDENEDEDEVGDQVGDQVGEEEEGEGMGEESLSILNVKSESDGLEWVKFWKESDVFEIKDFVSRVLYWEVRNSLNSPSSVKIF